MIPIQMRILCRLLLLTALWLPVISAAPKGPATLEHVVFMGASASAGFGTNVLPSTLFEKAIVLQHRPVETFASPLFFLNPSGEGARQADRAIASKPSMAVGTDYLFWYVYGAVSDEPRTGETRREESPAAVEKRMSLLERGLAQLERLDFPVAVGDIPDMEGADPQMLAPRQIPGPKTLEVANRRIRDWAKSRPDVLVLPLADWVSEMRAGKTQFTIPGGRTLQYPAERWLQADKLHPSKLGTVLLCARVSEALQSWAGVSSSELRFDVEQALKDIGFTD